VSESRKPKLQEGIMLLFSNGKTRSAILKGAIPIYICKVSALVQFALSHDLK
jgi:hypothetical protein